MKIGEKKLVLAEVLHIKTKSNYRKYCYHENWQRAVDLAKKANLYACWSEPIISSENEVLGTLQFI